MQMTLPFRSNFAAPVGGKLECKGTGGWLYRDPDTGTDVRFYDSMANSYTRYTGGMVGSVWTVLAVQPHSAGGSTGLLVTLEASR